jgi:hypothetical protein
LALEHFGLSTPRPISMSLLDYPAAFSSALFLVLIMVEEIGIHLRQRMPARIDEVRHEQITASRDTVGVLLSLLLGFTLAMALERFDHRKELVVDEANAITRTSLRAQTLPEPVRSQAIELLRQYVDARLAYASTAMSGQELDTMVERTKQLQRRLWDHSTAVARESPTPTISIFLQSLNDTIDLGEKRLAALENRVPPPIWLMLVLISILTCFIVGLGVKRKFWVMTLIWPLTISIVMGLIADLDAPRSGLIQVSQQSMRRLQQDLKNDGGQQR